MKKEYIYRPERTSFRDRLGADRPDYDYGYESKSVNYSEIPAIAVAAYTVFKIVTATMSYVKTRKLSNVGITMLKNVNFIRCDSFRSYAAIYACYDVRRRSNGEYAYRLRNNEFCVFGFLVAVSITNLIKAVKIKRAA